MCLEMFWLDWQFLSESRFASTQAVKNHFNF